MSHGPAWTWTVLFFLGAYHGINPGMGWLFAVALGMQKRSGAAVWQSLLPIAAGHAIAISVVIAAATILGYLVTAVYIRILVACVLLGFGIYRLLHRGHPRWGGMQIGFTDLTIWSFLMACAHGAGFMVLPVMMSASSGHNHELQATAPIISGVWTATAAVAVHTLGYLFVTGAMAFIVYEWLGLGQLRKAWINLDLIWAFALIITAILTFAW